MHMHMHMHMHMSMYMCMCMCMHMQMYMCMQVRHDGAGDGGHGRHVGVESKDRQGPRRALHTGGAPAATPLGAPTSYLYFLRFTAYFILCNLTLYFLRVRCDGSRRASPSTPETAEAQVGFGSPHTAYGASTGVLRHLRQPSFRRGPTAAISL